MNQLSPIALNHKNSPQNSPTSNPSDFISKMRINSPIPRNNLPFQLDLNSLLLLNIHKIPSHPPRIRIPQNPIAFLLLSSRQFLRNTHPQTGLGGTPTQPAKILHLFLVIDVDDFLFGW